MRRSACVAAALLGLLTVRAAGVAACQGDCDGDGSVTVEEVVRLVDAALAGGLPGACTSADSDGDGSVSIDEVITAVGHALDGCPPPPRGELVIAASQPSGVLRQLPSGTLVGGSPGMPAQYRVRDPAEVRVVTHVTNLEVPWALAFAPDGRLFVSERPGRIRVVRNGALDPIPWATVRVAAVGESGLMGLALHPRFAAEPWVYVCHTVAVGNSIHNRILRIREEEGQGGVEQVLLDDIPAAAVHDGCRLKFGPDGKLYASTGDAFQRQEAQQLASLAGKILRLNDDGSVPADNPFGATSLVYSYGHRNPQGLAFEPTTGALFETEHGPSGEVGIGAHDEVNRIVAGANYGWPLVIGAPLLAQYRDPLLVYPDGAVPPSGATFYGSARIATWQGNLFFATLGSRHLQRVVFNSVGRVIALERLFDGVYGRLRDVIEGPDGALYVATSNRDGRGTPSGDDDRILRIEPR